MDKELIGSVLNALPIDKMIASPLNAMIQAQIASSKAYADFLLGVCVKDGKAVAAQFDYDEAKTDSRGVVTGVERRTIRIPLLAAITHPNIAIEEGNIDFELTISQSEESKSETSAEGGLAAQLGWGPFSVKMHGSVSHKQEQTRKTDTRAKYSFSVKAARQGPPEALMRVMDLLTDAGTKGMTLPTNQDAGKIEDLKGIDGPEEKKPAT